MGFFGSLFKNPLGTIANTVKSTVQSPLNILSGKGNIGDLLGTASLFYGGGGGDFFKRFGTGNLLGNLKSGALQQIGGSIFNNTPGRKPMPVDYGGGFGSLTKPGDIANWLSPGVGQEAGFYNQTTGNRLGALQNAYDAADPRNFQSLIDAYSQSAMGGTSALGRRTGNMLSRQYGEQPGLRAGANLSAINQANNQIGQFRNQTMSPFNLSNAYMQQANVLGGGNIFQGLPFAMQSLQSQGNINASKPASPTFLDTLTGLAGTASSMGIDWGQVFSKPSGGGGTVPYDGGWLGR